MSLSQRFCLFCAHIGLLMDVPQQTKPAQRCESYKMQFFSGILLFSAQTVILCFHPATLCNYYNTSACKSFKISGTACVVQEVKFKNSLWFSFSQIHAGRHRRHPDVIVLITMCLALSTDCYGPAAHALHPGHPQHGVPSGAGICGAVCWQRWHQVPEDAVQGFVHGKEKSLDSLFHQYSHSRSAIERLSDRERFSPLLETSVKTYFISPVEILIKAAPAACWEDCCAHTHSLCYPSRFLIAL